MNLTERIEALIAPALADKGLGVVRIDLQGSERKTLQIMIERTDDQNVSIDDCVVANDIISALMDVEDPIKESYMLEVSSAGMDRPLVKREDFKRFAGAVIKLELKAAFEGARRWQGTLEGIEDDKIKISLDNFGIAEIPYSDVQKAKLVPQYEFNGQSRKK